MAGSRVAIFGRRICEWAGRRGGRRSLMTGVQRYRADKLQLVSGSSAGTALDAVEVQESDDGTPVLK